jgi:hypothetical protein
MEIAHATRSEFLEPCEVAIRRNKKALDEGGVISIGLKNGGYDGRVIVTIQSDSWKFFLADWKNIDPTRFPTRIKAAATALLNCHCDGQFEISHSNGALSIRAL